MSRSTFCLRCAPQPIAVHGDPGVGASRDAGLRRRAGGQTRATAGRARGPRPRLHRQVAQPGAVCRPAAAPAARSGLCPLGVAARGRSPAQQSRFSTARRSWPPGLGRPRELVEPTERACLRASAARTVSRARRSVAPQCLPVDAPNGMNALHSTTTHHPAGWLGPSRRVCHTPNDAGVQSNSRVWGRRETPGPHRAGRPKPSSRLPQWRGVLGHRGSDCTGKWHGPELCLGGPTATTAARSGPCTGRRAAEGGTVWCRSPPSKSASRRPAVLARQVSADREN